MAKTQSSKTKKTVTLWFLIPTLLLTVALFTGMERTSGTDQDPLYDYDVEERIAELGIELQTPTPPTANYVRAIRTGNLVFLAGHGPDRPEGGQVTGTMGTGELTLEEGQEAARFTGISLLTSLKTEIGDLNKVSRIVKVTGMVNADPSYTEHSQVINGFSDLMVEIFEDRGRHARASVGMSSLPGNIPVEIDMIVEVAD
ncbi:MAG: RidA family protein [Balneolaceae bacterium]|nr:RidA family protein [Balneolaceae bacterium]